MVKLIVMHEKKIVEPRIQTPAPGATVVTGRLPDDLLGEQTRRVAVLAAVGGGLWTFGLFLDAVLVPLRFHVAVPRMAVAIEILSVAVSVVTFVYVRFSSQAPQTKTEIGLGYMIYSSFAVALSNTWSINALQQNLGHLSWITIIILVSS